MRQIETKLNLIPSSVPSASNTFYRINVQQLPWELVVVIKMKSSEKRKGYGLKRVVVSQHNYLALKRLGQAGDSFNDVITNLLLIQRNYQQEKKQQERNDDHNSNGSSISESYSSNFISEAIEQDNQRIAKLIRMHEEEQQEKQEQSSKTNNKARK